MAVVIQKRVHPAYSGAAFSSNPVTGARMESVISIIQGSGEALLSGTTAGEDLVLVRSDDVADHVDIPEHASSITDEAIRNVYSVAQTLEKQLGHPVDIEWCIDADGKLYILQLRPVTALVPRHRGVIPIRLANREYILAYVAHHDKVAIRLVAEKANVSISPAYLVVQTAGPADTTPDLSVIQPTDICRGFSVVLIYPRNIGGKVIRHFAQRGKSSQKQAYRTCQRYTIRAYEERDNIEDVVRSIYRQCSEYSWVCITILQEIYQPWLTGVARRIADGYVVEVARGHFVPKGIVPMSRYITSLEGQVAFKEEVVQLEQYEIIDGEVEKKHVGTLVSLTDVEVSTVVDGLRPILDAERKTVEFGLLRDDERNTLTPYLIDLVDDNRGGLLDSELISKGVLSKGVITGRIIDLTGVDMSNESVDKHISMTYQLEMRRRIRDIIYFYARPRTSDFLTLFVGTMRPLLDLHSGKVRFLRTYPSCCGKRGFRR